MGLHSRKHVCKSEICRVDKPVKLRDLPLPFSSSFSEEQGPGLPLKGKGGQVHLSDFQAKAFVPSTLKVAMTGSHQSLLLR